MGKKKVKEPDSVPKDEFDAVELITKRPETVVLVLQSEEESVLFTVCEALYKFAEKSSENKQQLLSYGPLEHLIRLISHENKMIKRNAVMCLGTLSSEESARRLVRKLGGIPPLLALLSPEEDLICHEFASLTLSYLAEDYTSKVEIFEKHGLSLLINHLMSSDCDVQRNSVQAVYHLLQDFQSRAAFKELNGVEPLLKLLDSEYPAIQELSLSALITCVQDADNKMAMRELEGLSKLVDIIGNEKMNDLHLSCLKCLAICMEDLESVKLIQSTGVFQKLLCFIADSNTPETQQYAASVIAASCKVDENRKIFSEQETEKTLISLLTCDNISVVVAAVNALAIMAESPLCCELIGKQDGIPLIIPLLKNDLSDAKQTAALALANLTNSNTYNGAIVMEKNTIDILIRLLTDENSETQSNSAICLSNLAANETWRSEIEKHGVVGGLLEAMKSPDPKVEVSACMALAPFVCDHEARMEVLSENGIPVLLDLLKSNDSTVRRHASWVIVLCATDGNLAEEVTKCGGLDILQGINLSSKKNKFTDIAFERILNSNLSAKYSIMGYLSYDNVINELFYDPGKTGVGSKVLTLDELANKDIDHNRPVILVNLKKMDRDDRNQASLKRKIVNGVSSEKSISKSKQEHKKGSKTKISKDNEEIKGQQQKLSTHEKNDKPEKSAVIQGRPDNTLLTYLTEIQSELAAVMSSELQVQVLACYVCEKMGGVINKDDIMSFSYELHISELKKELNSNVIPIGKIRKGIYYHRALLFKVLADHFSVRSTLCRGDYGRAWNEIQLYSRDENGNPILPPAAFVVDLIHYPGVLYPVGSPGAISYQKI